ncbi:hypothetical protein [Kurthia gibsonii]|uniref:hypothetical protein n=1 Tax=Kurthia gibsonii TaxID=33946 RepID=UPI0030199A39
MKETVTLTVLTGESWEGLRRETLLVDVKEYFSAGPLSECPEDAILERDLIGPSDITEFLESFLQKHNGKKLVIEYGDLDEDE